MRKASVMETDRVQVDWTSKAGRKQSYGECARRPLRTVSTVVPVNKTVLCQPRAEFCCGQIRCVGCFLAPATMGIVWSVVFGIGGGVVPVF